MDPGETELRYRTCALPPSAVGHIGEPVGVILSAGWFGRRTAPAARQPGSRYARLCRGVSQPPARGTAWRIVARSHGSGGTPASASGGILSVLAYLAGTDVGHPTCTGLCSHWSSQS